MKRFLIIAVLIQLSCVIHAQERKQTVDCFLNVIQVSESAGTIYFNGPAGKYTITNK